MEDDLSEFKLSKRVKEKLKDSEQIRKEIEAGKTAQEVLELSNATMAKFYKAAYTLFENKRYEAAADAFLFLATLNPYIHDYWLGLGMATQMLHDFEAAIDAYELASFCDESSPIPFFYLAKCLFAIHDRESALQALDLAIEAADDIEEYSTLKIEAKEARRILLKHGKEPPPEPTTTRRKKRPPES